MAASSWMATFPSPKMSLDHPLHEHALTLREITNDCTVKCRLCKQNFHGPAYCCEVCDFILHEACAQIEFPLLIEDYPSHHPGHPLNLARDDEGRRVYSCSDCGFNLDVLTAIATRLPSRGVKEETIWHFGHEEHPLSSFRTETVLQAPCGFCKQQIYAGQVYGCRSCLFLLHEPCAWLSHEIHHPLHQHSLSLDSAGSARISRCKLCCRNIRPDPAYCCEECEFALHVGCAAVTMPARNGPKKDMDEEEDFFYAFIYDFHEHPLITIHVEELGKSDMRCRICGLAISGCEALACGDRSCSWFVLHQSCVMDLPEEIQHYLHPQHPRLVLQPKISYRCGCCRGSGFHFAFSCEDCEFNLEPVCALETLSAIEDGAAAYVSWFGHEHPLTLAFKFSNSGHTCSACKKSIDGPAYYCLNCVMCPWFHISCVQLPRNLEHAFHPQHPLLLSEAPAWDYLCFACHETHAGLAFYCAECEFYLGVQCASLNPTLKHPRHEHSLGYYERNTTKHQLQCNYCGKRCKYDFYCCMRCNFSLHSDCLHHLPPTVNHKSHYHPLQLRDKFVRGNLDDQYCDYCETIRNPDVGVYRCEECDFSAHVDCIAISDYNEEAKGSETWGSDRSNQLNIEIASLNAKIEIMRKDLDALGANLETSVAKIKEIDSESKL